MLFKKQKKTIDINHDHVRIYFTSKNKTCTAESSVGFIPGSVQESSGVMEMPNVLPLAVKLSFSGMKEEKVWIR